jgi:hypothetical protein
MPVVHMGAGFASSRATGYAEASIGANPYSMF